MKKFHNPFKRPANGGIINTFVGIGATEYAHVHDIIKREYDNTAAAHKKPTEYMRGLAYALSVIEANPPYPIKEVQ